jgi:hypothetical protein
MTNQHERLIRQRLVGEHLTGRLQFVRSQLNSRRSDTMTDEQIKQFVGLIFRMLLMATAAPIVIELVSLLP